MILTSVSTWIGVVAYSLIIGVAITWIGISIANWSARHALCSILLGLGALCWATYFSSVLIIASDWFPGFSGIYVALFTRSIAMVGSLALVAFTVIYLNGKRKQESC